MMVFSPPQKVVIKKTLIFLELFVKKFTIHSLSALHKRGVPKLKENYAPMILGPQEALPGTYGVLCVKFLTSNYKIVELFKILKELHPFSLEKTII